MGKVEGKEDEGLEGKGEERQLDGGNKRCKKMKEDECERERKCIWMAEKGKCKRKKRQLDEEEENEEDEDEVEGKEDKGSEDKGTERQLDGGNKRCKKVKEDECERERKCIWMAEKGKCK